MQIELTIKLDGVELEVDCYFDSDDNGVYVEQVNPTATANEEQLQAWADASDREQDAAIWAAYDAYVKESNEP